jgi:hypothetical protein
MRNIELGEQVEALGPGPVVLAAERENRGDPREPAALGAVRDVSPSTRVASSRRLTASKVAVDSTATEADCERLDEAQRPGESHVADEGHARSGVGRVETPLVAESDAPATDFSAIRRFGSYSITSRSIGKRMPSVRDLCRKRLPTPMGPGISASTATTGPAHSASRVGSPRSSNTSLGFRRIAMTC